MRHLFSSVIAVVLAFTLSGCASQSTDESANECGDNCAVVSDQNATNDSGGDAIIASDAIILDVRTPEEYAEGHLNGAQNIDFNAGELQAALENLDPSAEYLVYCRSGNRSGQTVALMEQAGFANVTDLGPLQNAADQTGIEIITGN